MKRADRGFTLLETLLAAVIAGVVLTGALAVLDVIRRADGKLRERAAYSQSLVRVQNTVRDALDALVVEPTTPEEPGTPRFVLEQQVAGSFSAQRLELVISRQLFDPIEEQQRRAQLTANETNPNLIGLDDLQRHRGAFELVPAGDTASLVWRRLPPIDLPDGLRFDARTLPPPVVLAEGITGIQWRAFQGRIRRTVYAGAQEAQLPAYIELELQGLGGPGASFLFAVNWTTDARLQSAVSPLATEGEGTDAAEQGEGADLGDFDIPEELQDELRGFDPATLGTPGGGS